jgi:hypothetical protein
MQAEPPVAARPAADKVDIPELCPDALEFLQRPASR